MFSGRVRRRGNADKIIDRVLAEIRAGPNRVKVGFPKGETDSDILLRAAVNELGSSDGRIPERPFIQITMAGNKDKYLGQMKTAARSIVQGRTDKRAVLSKLGLQAAGDIQETIATSVPPPNAPSTVARKGSSTTLIDTGQMRQSTTWALDED